MTLAHLRIALAAFGAVAVSTPTLAQRGPAPEQQIYNLQQQLAASQASATRMEQRLSAIENQLQQVVNAYETSSQRLRVIEAALQELRAEQQSRPRALEQAEPAETPPVASSEPETPAVSQRPSQPASQPAVASAPQPDAAPADPGEDAYSEGFRHWEAKRYDAAIASLRAFTTAFPKHRRVSWANNLTGRALLDKGEPRAAAEVLLANYRTNPRGGRAQDSLYYLGQALVALGQADQACKAYSELTGVYGTAVRSDLQPLVDRARAESNCR